MDPTDFGSNSSQKMHTGMAPTITNIGFLPSSHTQTQHSMIAYQGANPFAVKPMTSHQKGRTGNYLVN